MAKREEIDERTWRLVRRIAKNIRELREKRGWTQEDMEEQGYAPRWYQRLESGRYIPTLPTLDRLARTFRVGVTDLFR